MNKKIDTIKIYFKFNKIFIFSSSKIKGIKNTFLFFIKFTLFCRKSWQMTQYNRKKQTIDKLIYLNDNLYREHGLMIKVFFLNRVKIFRLFSVLFL